MDEKTTLLIDVQVSASEALKRQEELKVSLQQQKEVLKQLEVEQGKTSQAYIAQEATVKNLNNQLAANGRVLTQMAGTATTASGAYAELNQRSAQAAQRAKDLAAAYGMNDERAKAAAKEAKALSDQLKEVDSSVGQNQRRVGDYAGELGKLPGIFGKVAGGTQNMGATFTALKANPLFAILSVVVSLFTAISNAMGSGTESGRKLQQVMAPLNDLFKGLVKVMADFFSVILSGASAVAKFAGEVLSFIPAIDKMNKAGEESIRIEKEKQRLLREGMVDKAADAKEELRIAELKKKIMQADKYSNEERLAFAREVDKAERQMALDDANRANNNLKNFLANMKLQGKAQKDYSDEEMQTLTDLQTAKYAEQQKYYDNTRRTASREAALIEEIERDKNAKIEANNAAAQERREQQEARNKQLADERKAQTEAEIKAFDEAQKKMIASREAALKAVNDLQFGIEEEPEVDTGSAIQYQKDLEAAKQLIRESSDLAYLDYQQTQLDKEYQAAIENANKIGADTTAIEAAYVETKKKLNQAEISAKMDMASSFAGNIAEIFGKNTKVGKMAASAQIAIDTAKGAMAAFTSMQSVPVVGPALGAAAAGAVIAKGVRSIKDVWAVKSGLKGDSGGGGASVSTSAASGGMPASVTGALVSRNSGQVQQAATSQAVDAALKQNPVQPVLVTNDLTTALDQKVQIKSDNSL